MTFEKSLLKVLRDNLTSCNLAEALRNIFLGYRENFYQGDDCFWICDAFNAVYKKEFEKTTNFAWDDRGQASEVYSLLEEISYYFNLDWKIEGYYNELYFSEYEVTLYILEEGSFYEVRKEDSPIENI